MTGTALCVGPVAVDLVVEGFAPSDPARLARWTGPATVRTLAAGSIGYAAQSLTALGRRARLVTCVGDDALGQEAIAQWASAGIPVDGVVVQPGETGLAIYLRLFGDSKRPMVFRAAEFDPWPAAIELDVPERPDVVVVSGALHFPQFAAAHLESLLRAARAASVPVVLDPQFAAEDRDQPWSREFAGILAHTDVLCCDEREGAQLFGSSDASDIIDRAHAAGCRVVIVKREHLGAVLDDGHQRIYQRAISLGSGIGSTIGSGDAFLAGVTSALLDGSSLAELARWGTAAATVAITAPDGIRGISLAAVTRTLAQVPAPQPLHVSRQAGHGGASGATAPSQTGETTP